MRRMGTAPIWTYSIDQRERVTSSRQKYTANPERAKGEAFQARTWSRFEKVLAPVSWAGTQTLTNLGACSVYRYK